MFTVGSKGMYLFLLQLATTLEHLNSPFLS